MKRDVVATYNVLAELLSNTQQRRAWALDPWGYASNCLAGVEEIAMVAGLNPDGLSAASLHLDILRATAKDTHQQEGSRDPQSVLEGTNIPSGPVRASATDHGKEPLVGLGYWPDLFDHFGTEEIVQVWEHRIDDSLDNGPSLRRLLELADRGPIVMHSVDLSIGSAEALSDPHRLSMMRRILRETGAQELSDHLCFTRAGRHVFNHFVPLWRVEEAVELAARNIERIQDAIGLRLAVENVAPMFDPGGEMTVAEFLNELVERTGCGVLLDITNLTISERSGFSDVGAELARLNLEAVIGMHLAGGTEVDGFLYDAHAFPLSEIDLSRLHQLLPLVPNCRSVVIERDGRRHALNEVTADLQRVRAVAAKALQ